MKAEAHMFNSLLVEAVSKIKPGLLVIMEKFMEDHPEYKNKIAYAGRVLAHQSNNLYVLQP